MNDDLFKISVVGSGNVASQLIPALSRSKVVITHLSSRNEQSAQGLLGHTTAHKTCQIEELPLNQLALLCVPDDQILPILHRLDPRIEVAYTSGNLHLNQIETSRSAGVFYPLQTFSRERVIDMSAVPMLIEANTKPLESQLLTLAKRISKKVYTKTSDERQQVHQVAVWVNNFTNHILYHARDLSGQYELDFSLFEPLLRETIDKLAVLSPENAQTGPARRGDQRTIQSHLSQLSGIRKEIYDLLSRSIMETYSSKTSKK